MKKELKLFGILLVSGLILGACSNQKKVKKLQTKAKKQVRYRQSERKNLKKSHNHQAPSKKMPQLPVPVQLLTLLRIPAQTSRQEKHQRLLRHWI